MIPSPERSLLARVYGVGLLQLAALAGVALLVGYLTLRPEAHERHHRRLDDAEIARLAAHLSDRAMLARDVEAILASSELEVTVFDASGAVLASNVTPPLSARPHGPPPRHAPRPGDPSGFHGLPPDPHGFGPDHAFPPDHGPPPHGFPPWFGPPEPPRHVTRYELVRAGVTGYAISRPTPDPLRFLPALATFLGALLVVTIGSFLLARSIVRPLGTLASTAKRFGRGDLHARVGLARNDEIGAVGRAFDDMAERIERLVRTEKELLANVSHELRTPLSRIRVALDLASEGDASMAREALSEIALDLEELEGLVDDVLTATRLSIGEGVARPPSLVRTREPCDPQAIAERSAERFRIHHEKRDFALELEALPIEVVGDPALLRRVLDNLLENAEKYSPDPSTPIRLRVRYAAPNVIFEVRDRGIGIADEDLPHLFEPFFRADRSRTRATGGVGLGLTLAKRIVEAHDGEIRVESAKDEGTCVSVLVPARPSID